ncbi:MAG: YHS domain-containing protein [Anaerolineales bacterium]|nr:YHS domain-containing protein [Anaerolineales bacterium]
MATDPVCGMEVEESTAKYVSEYKDELYYFCAPGCKHTFEKEPASFIGPNRRPFIPMDEVPTE